MTDLSAFVAQVKRRDVQRRKHEELVRELMMLLESYDSGEIEQALKQAQYRINFGEPE